MQTNNRMDRDVVAHGRNGTEEAELSIVSTHVARLPENLACSAGTIANVY